MNRGLAFAGAFIFPAHIEMLFSCLSIIIVNQRVQRSLRGTLERYKPRLLVLIWSAYFGTLNPWISVFSICSHRFHRF